MKRFFKLVITNLANVLKPILILALVTMIVQVGMYNFRLATREDYKLNENLFRDADSIDVICEIPVEFMAESDITLFGALMLISIVVSVMLVALRGREKDNKISILRVLPASRGYLFRAKATANSICIVFIYIINLACVGISYLVFETLIPYKFRELGLYRLTESAIYSIINILVACILCGIIIASDYCKKNYTINS